MEVHCAKIFARLESQKNPHIFWLNFKKSKLIYSSKPHFFFIETSHGVDFWMRLWIKVFKVFFRWVTQWKLCEQTTREITIRKKKGWPFGNALIDKYNYHLKCTHQFGPICQCRMMTKTFLFLVLLSASVFTQGVYGMKEKTIKRKHFFFLETIFVEFCRQFTGQLCKHKQDDLLESVTGLTLENCQKMCSQVYPGQCKYFSYNQRQSTCKLYQVEPVDFQSNCQKIGGPDYPNMTACESQDLPCKVSFFYWENWLYKLYSPTHLSWWSLKISRLWLMVSKSWANFMKFYFFNCLCFISWVLPQSVSGKSYSNFENFKQSPEIGLYWLLQFITNLVTIFSRAKTLCFKVKSFLSRH